MAKKSNLCGKPVQKAKNGTDRGFCIRPTGHSGQCGNRNCHCCGIKLLKPSEYGNCCNSCSRIWHKARRLSLGMRPQTGQFPNKKHVFICGCSGTLPKRNKSNKFSIWKGKFAVCRVGRILSTSLQAAKAGGFVPMSKIPHSEIRSMMDKPCVYCGAVFDWYNLGTGKTPHCDHDHETGEIYGFACPNCNLRAVKNTADKLRKELMELKKKLKRYRITSDNDGHKYFIKIEDEKLFDPWVAYEENYGTRAQTSYSGPDFNENRIDGRFTFTDPRNE